MLCAEFKKQNKKKEATTCLGERKKRIEVFPFAGHTRASVFYEIKVRAQNRKVCHVPGLLPRFFLFTHAVEERKNKNRMPENKNCVCLSL